MEQSSVKKVVMSKRVALDFLKKSAHEGRTLTVFFSDEDSMQSFMANAHKKWGNKISMCEGFDQITVLSLDKKSMKDMESYAVSLGLDVTDI